MNDNSPQIIEDTKWWTVDTSTSNPWQTALLVAIAVFVVLVAIWFYQRKNRGVPLFKPPNPADVALKALRELEPLIVEDNYQEYVIRVSQILRNYIQGRFNLRALHRSTEEFLREAQQHEQLSPADRELLGDFLVQCDWVKFAQRGMAISQMKFLFGSALSFVEGTAQTQAARVRKA